MEKIRFRYIFIIKRPHDFLSILCPFSVCLIMKEIMTLTRISGIPVCAFRMSEVNFNNVYKYISKVR